ncbi:MAG TPA: transglycosylase SLT domain-containing protein [Casimicrobiaceae bacterium]|jgi:soluble lytic murein transglycosylase
MMIRLDPFLRVLRTLLVLVTLMAASRALAQADADVLRAKDAFDRGDRRRLDALAPQLEGHLLTPYVTYWQLELGIDTADPAAVRRFLAREAGSPLADRLRGDWLKSLARRGAWSDFDEDYVAPPGEDLELTCYAVQRRRDLTGDAALGTVRAAWFTGQRTPEACDPLFAALFARGDLDQADRRARMRLASEAGNTRLVESLGDDMPGAERIASREFAAITRDPLRALTQGAFAWKSAKGRDLALFALERAARKDASAARAAWVKWRARLPAPDRTYGNRRLAYHAARQLEPAALDWFREAGAAAGSSDEIAWRVRAALRDRAWSDVLAGIDALPDADRQDPAWRYWKGRALAASGRKAEADALFSVLASNLGFYGLLAADALGDGAKRVASLQAVQYVPDATELATFSRRYDVQRVVKLMELDLRAEALREWAYIVREQPDDRLLLAAEFARRAGLYDRAINAAERTSVRHDFGMRYPTPFRAEFTAAARDQGVDEALLYGIARQESRFVPDIVSSAGAVGLMQIMPRTARWVAGKMARTDLSPAQIASAGLNTQFGAFYFRYWHDRFDQQPAVTAAAYNAGPSRAQAWRPSAAPLEGAIWVETIPFNETRDYVKKVLANTVLYARALNLPYVSLTERLGTVTPRGSDNATLASRSP